MRASSSGFIAMASILLAACASASAGSAPEEHAPRPPPDAADDAGATPTPGDASEEDLGELSFDGRFARAARLRPGGGALVVLERPVSFRELTADPDRDLAWIARSGSIEARAT